MENSEAMLRIPFIVNQTVNPMKRPEEQQADGNWNQFKGRLREAWGSLTDDDIDRYKGRRDQLVGYVQEKTGEARENVDRTMNRLSEESDYRF
jgi:uncharacterized protein YjbJ (UPF0337 family)